jgi:peptide/nickel transport system permease protein
MRLVGAIGGRAVQLLIVIFLVTSVTFLLSSLIPGDFFTSYQLDPTIRAETIRQMRHTYGLDLPVHQQYLLWLKNLARLDLGYSLFFRASVSSIVLQALARTLWIGIPALVLGMCGGILLGTLHALRRDRPAGQALDFVFTVALSLPSIVLGLAALMLAAQTHWFPLGSMSSSSLQEPGFWRWLADRLHHLILPVSCLTVPIMASVERIQFAATRTSLGGLFVRSAQARGLGRARIFTQYLLRPALNPILSTSGPMIGGVLSGSLVLEIIFSWPGLGQITYDALFNRDLFLLVGCVIASGLLLAAGNLAADLALFALDPRARQALGRVRP